MSHDLAWNSAKRDRAIPIKDILREAGDDEEYVSYIDHKLEIEEMFM